MIMAVAVVILLLLVLFFWGSARDYHRRWRNEKLWSERLQGLLSKTRDDLACEKRLRMMAEIKPQEDE